MAEHSVERWAKAKEGKQITSAMEWEEAGGEQEAWVEFDVRVVTRGPRFGVLCRSVSLGGSRTSRLRG